MMLVSTKWELCLLPYAGCCLVLRSSEAVIVASYSLETHISVLKVDRRVLATDIDADLWLINCVWDRIGQMARRSTQERSYTGFNLIPVSGVGEAVGDDKIGRNGIEGTFSNDMTCGELTFGHTNKSSSPGAKRFIISGVRRRAQREKVRVCAYRESLSLHYE